VIAEVGARHGVQAPRAFSEANVLAMIAGVMAPAAIVLGRASGLGWRSALWLPAAVVVAVTLLRRRLPTLGTRGTGVDRAGSLPRAFWSWLWVVVGVAATEGSILIWSATLLHERAALGAGAAAGSLAVYYVAEFAGRLAGSRVSGRLAPPLLVASLLTALAGLLLLWGARSPLLAVGALALTGLGMANLYPLAVGLALTQAPGLANAASSRVSLAIGCASLASPFALGALADVAGIGPAFGLTPALVLATALTLTLALRARRPRAVLP
jgi:fucose permease